MKTFELRQTQTIEAPLGDVFEFFADPRNLGVITPPWLGFRMLTPEPIVMAPGTLIDYAIRLRGFPMRWRSEITRWEPPTCFVDEQRRGPYTFWVHEHTFESMGKTTRIRDHVRYGVPGGWWIHRWVRKDLERIFRYRAASIAERFDPRSDTATHA